MNALPAPDCVIFDCDGTLVDSEQIAVDLLVEMAGEIDARFEGGYAALERWRGMKLALCVEQIAQRAAVPAQARAASCPFTRKCVRKNLWCSSWSWKWWGVSTTEKIGVSVES